MQVYKFGALLLATISIGCLTGCGAGPQEIVQPSSQDVSQLKALRAIFDSVHGDYSQLTETQKQQFLTYGHGHQSEVDHLWAFMTDPKGGGTPAAQNPHFTQGPNGQILPPGGTTGTGGGSNR